MEDASHPDQKPVLHSALLSHTAFLLHLSNEKVVRECESFFSSFSVIYV